LEGLDSSARPIAKEAPEFGPFWRKEEFLMIQMVEPPPVNFHERIILDVDHAPRSGDNDLSVRRVRSLRLDNRIRDLDDGLRHDAPPTLPVGIHVGISTFRNQKPTMECEG
jgi:hypothetical protein